MTHDIENKQASDESERLASTAFWITMVGTVAFCGSVYAFVL